ncbi:MAG: hypothetical protein OHK0045_09540 [Raineya sp.]
MLLLLLFNNAWGQVSIPSTPERAVLIDFSNTLTGVNNGIFNPGANSGDITNNAPAAGQLDGDAWHFVNDGANVTNAATFPAGTQAGGRNAAFSTAPGGAANNATGQGWYGFNIGGSNPALGWQPQGTFATPGMITLRVVNNTGVTLTALDVSYKVLERNNSSGSNRVRFYHSSTNAASSYTLINSMDVLSTNAEPAGSFNIVSGAGLGVEAGITPPTRGGTVVRINHTSGANTSINLNDIIFITNGINNGTGLRRVSGFVVDKPSATETEIEIDTSITFTPNANPGGQFTVVPLITHVRSTTLNVNIPNGGEYFIRWFLNDGGADEMAIDDIAIVGNPEGLKITENNVSYVIDFEGTLDGVNNGQFTASATIATTNPGVGQLNSNTWAFMSENTRLNDGSAVTGTFPNQPAQFGGTVGSGQGVSAGNVTTGGWYAFDVPFVTLDITSTSRALGWQQTDAFATPGSITLRVTNLTGNNIKDFRISYTIWEQNNAAGQNRVRAYLSTDNTTYVDLGANYTYTTTDVADALGWRGRQFDIIVRRIGAFSSLDLTNGQSLYFRLYLDYPSGGGDRDELAVDDITFLSSATPLDSRNINSSIVWAYDGADYFDAKNPVSDINGDGIVDAPYKGIETAFSDYATSIIPLHGIMTNSSAQRFKTINSPFSLGWAGDWLAGANPNTPTASNIYVTIGKEDPGNPQQKPTIPITSLSQQRSIVNSGMYIEGGGGSPIGRRIQTSTGGYAFQYTTNTAVLLPPDAAGSPTAYTQQRDPVPCTAVNNDCPSISPIRHRNDVRVVDQIRTATHATAGEASLITHTMNTRLGAQGSTVWLGVMLRKNHNNNEPVFISLHRNNNVWETHPNNGDPLNANTVQVGYFGVSCNDPSGNRVWGIRVNGVVTANLNPLTNHNTRITTAQDIGAGYVAGGQPDANSMAERVFDLLVVRIDFGHNGTPGTVQYVGTTKTGATNTNLGTVTTYSGNSRIRMYVIRDLARVGSTPNADAYPLVNNPRGYPNTGFFQPGNNLDVFSTNPAALDVPANTDLDYTTPTALDLSFHSVAYYPGNSDNQSAMDELRIGGSFSQAALNSPIISLIRGLCSANGGSLGRQAYQGGTFGEAQCLDANGNPVACPGGTTNSGATNGTQEIYDAASTNVWGSNVANSTLHALFPGGHPSYPNDANPNRVVRAGGATPIFSGGPTYGRISGGAYSYQLNAGSGPNDNNYLIGTQSRHSFGPAWIPFYDNSPNRNGYLMSINAAYVRGKFFDQTISGLCADTQYEFSVDIINVLRETRTITNESPVITPSGGSGITGVNLYTGNFFVARDPCDPNLEPGCGQMSRIGNSGQIYGVGASTSGGTGALQNTIGTNGSETAHTSASRRYSLNPEIDFALNDNSVYAVPISVPNDRRWHRVGLTFVTKANLATAVNLSMRNLAPGGMGNDLAIDNISFRPCGTVSQLFEENTACQEGSSAGGDGSIFLQIGKAGGSYSNARARFEKWCAIPSPLSNRLIADIDFDTPAAGQMRVTLLHSTGANIIPIGAEISFSDMDTSPQPSTVQLEGYTTTVISRPAANQIVVACPAGDCSGLTAFYDTYNTTDLLSGSVNFRMPITAATTTNPLTVTISDASNNIPVGMLVTFTNINGGTHPLNGQSGLITAKVGGTFTIGAIDASAMPAITSGFFTLSYPSNDLNSNGIDEENEWVPIDENYFNGSDYSDVDFPTNLPNFYTTGYVPVSPAGVDRRITQQTVYYPLGTRFRALFAGNSSNLNDESGKCRFVSPEFPLNCDFISPLPVTGANLRAARKMEGIELTWNVFQELKGYKYELERSYDALSFIPIAGYQANGSGVPYKHLDRTPYVGKNYYRVKISDENGKVIYTNVAQANWTSERAVNIYPNPASDKVNIAFSDDLGSNADVTIKVTNLMGLTLGNMQYKLAAGQRNLIIDTNSLPKGLYLLEIQVGVDEKIVHKLVIER